MMKCIAVDDEKLVLDLMVDNISKVPFLQLTGSFRNAIEAMETLHKEEVDLIFLDIQMPGLNGIQFLSALKNPPMVILVTAYKEYALEGFNLDVVDYLLKPVSFERFLKAVYKAQELFLLKEKNRKKELPGYFFVYVEYNQVKIMINDILFIEAMKDYVKIFLASTSKPVITRMSLKMLEEKLTAYRFLRIHKSYLVSVDKITSVKRDLVCIGNSELPLSENYKAGLSQMISF